MNELRLSENLALPREAATWVISYLAKRGAGKTYNSSVQAEEMLKQAIPIVVIDGMGIWWGLRVKADGKGEGYPLVVFGGEHADLPLHPEKAADMAKAVVETNISCVLDLSGFSKYMARKIVMEFLNKLYTLNRVDRHVYIEEADLWAPQRPIGQEEALCLSAVDNFVRRGGNHNLGVTLITQRSAVLNKDILTQSDCLVILRTLAPQDKKAIQAWVEEQTDKDKTELNQWYDSLKSLENGEAWVWHPEKPSIYLKTKFRLRETFHATREFIKSPQATKIVLMNVSEFVQKFQTVFAIKVAESGKPQDIKTDDATKRRIQELEQTVASKEKAREEAVNRANEATIQIEKLVAEVESLKPVQKLRDALLEFLPKQTSAPIVQNGNVTTINLNHQETNVVVSHTEKKIELTTANQQGQIMYVALYDLPKEGFTESEVSDALKEHGWNISHGSLAPQLTVNLAKAGLLIKIGDRPAKYRIPGQIKVSVQS